MLEIIKKRINNINLSAVIDHSGRGGNAFFLTIFDQHPEVLSCPLMHYTYSYILTEFGDSEEIEKKRAVDFLTTKSYFRLLYNEPTGDIGKLIYRMGLDSNVNLNRARIRELFDEYFREKKFVSRKELVIVPFLLYAASCNRDISKIKYVLVSDAISLRFEDVKKFFSGRVVDTLIKDFPKAKIFNIVRDPRATFASPRHQFVNSCGNMYALKFGNFWNRLISLLTRNFSADNGCIYLYWLLYIFQAYKTITLKKRQYPTHFYTVKNEDLNMNFSKTIENLAHWFEISFYEPWALANFQPTIAGSPWQGAGAYNNRYQQNVYGPLENDTPQVSSESVRPNEYVTKRWQQRLSTREVELIEHLFVEEMFELKYTPMILGHSKSNLTCLLHTALLPFNGELPTLKWIKNGVKVSYQETLQRIFYSISFLPFYVLSRLVFFDLVLRKKFFSLNADQKFIIQKNVTENLDFENGK